jgi:predicted nucleic acid-binding protein
MPAADRYFVDTNLLLYSVDSAEARKQERAWEWLQPLWEQGLGSLSWQVLREFGLTSEKR